MPTHTRTGRGWAYTGTALGGLVSIAANVAHSYVPPVDAPRAWRPALGAPLLAVFWPVALFVAIEILTRIDWQTGWRYVLLRFGGLIPVAGVAAIVSYMHLSGLLAHYSEPGITVRIGPLAVDGLMVMSAAALMSTTRRAPTAAAVIPAEVSAPVSRPVVVELPDRTPDREAAAEASGAVRTRVVLPSRPGRRSASRLVRHARTVQGTRTTPQQAERPAMTGQSSDTAGAASTTVPEQKRRIDASVAVPAMKIANPDMSADIIADRLGLSERTVRRHLPPKPDLVQHANGTKA